MTTCFSIGQLSLMLALLGAAAVFGTDTFFCVVGRAALARVSDAALVETMGRLHEVADRRMPIFGVVGIVGALASIAFSRASLPWALLAVTAQVLWIAVYPARRGAGKRRARPPCPRGLGSDRRAGAASAVEQRNCRADAADGLRGGRACRRTRPVSAMRPRLREPDVESYTQLWSRK
ncbi:MAG: hypothetical protein WDO69_15340 [Pseudomonadota bacterium]